MNRTLDMILRNLKTEIARITKENEDLKIQLHTQESVFLRQLENQLNSNLTEVKKS